MSIAPLKLKRTKFDRGRRKQLGRVIRKPGTVTVIIQGG